jgi:large repetitive protein
MTPTGRIFAAIGCAVAGLLAAPGLANAVVYCVPNATIDPSCQSGQSTITAALAAAQASTGTADTVRIGTGSFPVNDTYTGTATNTVQIIGAGAGLTQLTLATTAGNARGLTVIAPSGSTVSDLEMTIPVNADSFGDSALVLGGGTVGRRLLFDGPSATNAEAVIMSGTTVLAQSRVTFPIPSSPDDTAMAATSGGTPLITDSTLHTDIGVLSSGSDVTVQRSNLTVATGTSTDGGTMTVLDSVIDLGNRNSATGVDASNLNAGGSAIGATLDGDTIAGGGTNSVGLRAQADNGSETNTSSVSNTAIEGPTHAIQVLADGGRTATVTASYDNYAPATVNVNNHIDGGSGGTATYTPSNITDVSAGFVNPGAGNFHLLPSSQLIDIGDPAPPPAGRLDIDGDPRAIDATFDCSTTARRDIGADELSPAVGLKDCIPPDTSISGKAKVRTRKKKARVSFTLGSTEPGSTLQCSLDGGPFTPCTSPFSVKLRRGTHTLTARAIDPAGNVDSTPASFRTRVRRKR